METDIIEDLLRSKPAWMLAFPNLVGLEYPIQIQPCDRLGRGDLLLSNENFEKFLVVEVKRHTRKNGRLLHQLFRYRDAVKRKFPDAEVDGAAVANGMLLAYVRDRDFRPYKYRQQRPRAITESTRLNITCIPMKLRSGRMLPTCHLQTCRVL